MCSANKGCAKNTVNRGCVAKKEDVQGFLRQKEHQILAKTNWLAFDRRNSEDFIILTDCPREMFHSDLKFPSVFFIINGKSKNVFQLRQQV